MPPGDDFRLIAGKNQDRFAPFPEDLVLGEDEQLFHIRHHYQGDDFLIVRNRHQPTNGFNTVVLNNRNLRHGIPNKRLQTVPFGGLVGAGHVLISTWASVFHVLMAIGKDVSIVAYIAVLVFLFLAVWVPCCVSDIVFPLLFVKKKEEHHHKH